MPSSDYIQLSALDEPHIEAILCELPWRELQLLQKKHLKTGDKDTRIIARKLSWDMNFTLQTKIQLHYDSY